MKQTTPFAATKNLVPKTKINTEKILKNKNKKIPFFVYTYENGKWVVVKLNLT